MTSTRLVTGALLIATPLVFVAGFTGLQMTFGYPDILRQSAGDVLTRFAAGGADLHLFWYAMMAAALALIPASIGTGLLFWKRDSFLAALTIAFGVLAGLVQALGLLRWVILMPTLAANYVGGAAADQATAAALFELANMYLGAGVGEHFGYLFTGLWTVTVSALVWANHRYFAIVGLVIAAGVLAGMLEPFGVAAAGTIVSLSFTVWALWTLGLGVLVLRGARTDINAVPAAA